jgi:hypothetical protein
MTWTEMKWFRGLDSRDLEYGPVAGCSQHSNEPSGSTKCEELLDRLSSYQLPNVVLFQDISAKMRTSRSSDYSSWLVFRRSQFRTSTGMLF